MKQTERWAAFALFQFWHGAGWRLGALGLMAAGQLSVLWWVLQGGGRQDASAAAGLLSYLACVKAARWEWLFWLAAAGILIEFALGGVTQQRGSAQHLLGIRMLPVSAAGQVVGRFLAAFLWALALWTVQLAVLAGGLAMYRCFIPENAMPAASGFFVLLRGWLWLLYPVERPGALLITVLFLLLLGCCAAAAQIAQLCPGTRGGDMFTLIWAAAAAPIAWNLPRIFGGKYIFTGIASLVLGGVLFFDSLKRSLEVEEL